MPTNAELQKKLNAANAKIQDLEHGAKPRCI